MLLFSSTNDKDADLLLSVRLFGGATLVGQHGTRFDLWETFETESGAIAFLRGWVRGEDADKPLKVFCQHSDQDGNIIPWESKSQF